MIIKPEPGGPRIPFFVVRIEDSKNNRNQDEWKFVGRTATEPDALAFVSVATAERQCKRIGLDRSTIVNRWVEFSKTANGYIDINLTTGDAPPPPPAAAPAPQAAQSTGTAAPSADAEAAKERTRKLWNRECKLYDKCVEHILAEIVPKLQQGKITITQEGVSAMSASLYIGCQKRGL